MIPMNTEAQDISAYLIRFEDLKFEKAIGAGGYGEVFLGYYIPTNTKVAIKRLFEVNESERIKQLFLREIQTLSIAKNKFLLPFKGYTNTPPYCIVTTYMNNGSLYDALHSSTSNQTQQSNVKHKKLTQKHTKSRSRSKNSNPLSESKGKSDMNNENIEDPQKLEKQSKKLTPAQKTLIAYGISNGMQFLHSKNLIHRDLKTQNVLLDEDFAPVICDFGTSRFLEGVSAMTGNLGTMNYMAPEFIQGNEYNLSIDVYSYGMILWEMLTEQVPFFGLESAQVILKAVIQQSRPPIPENTPHNLKMLIERCWSPNPIDRPSFEQISKLFENRSIEYPGIDHDEYSQLIQKVMPHYRTAPYRRHSDSVQYNEPAIADRQNNAYNLRQERVCKSSMVNRPQPNLFSITKTVEESLEALKGNNAGQIRKALDFFDSISNDRIIMQIDIWPPLLAFLQRAQVSNNESQSVSFAKQRPLNLETNHKSIDFFNNVKPTSDDPNFKIFRNYNGQISKSNSANIEANNPNSSQQQINESGSQSIDLNIRTKSFDIFNLNTRRSNVRNYSTNNYDAFIANSNESLIGRIPIDLVKKAEMLIEKFATTFEILETIKRVPDLSLHFFANDAILFLFLYITTNLPQLIDTKIVSQLFNFFQDRRYSLRAASLVCLTVKYTPNRKMITDILEHLEKNISNYVDMIGGHLILKLLLYHKYLKTEDITMFSRSDIEDNVIAAYQCLFSINGPPELFSLSNVLLNCLSMNEELRDVACEFIRRYAVGADNEPLMLISTAMFKMIFQYESEKALLLLIRVSSDPKRCSSLINTGFIGDFLNAKPSTALLLLKIFLTIIKADERCKKYFFMQPQISTFFANVASNNNEEADISLCWSLNQINVLPELAANLVKSGFIQMICDYITSPPPKDKVPKVSVRDANNSILLDDESSSSNSSTHSDQQSTPKAFSMHPIKLSWFLRTIATVSLLADCDRYNNVVKLLFSLIEQKSVISHNCLITLAALSMQVSTHELMYHGMQTVLSRYIDNTNENQFVNQIMMNIKKGGRIRI